MTKKITFKFVSGKDTDNNLFCDAYKILNSSFPKNEYRSLGAQQKLLNYEPYNFLFCFYDKELAGLIAYYNLSELLFVEHLAIKPEYRNNGLGGKMLNQLTNSTALMVILEVELPYNEISKRRINFYKKHDFVLNNYEYYQMPLNPSDKPLQLLIMSFRNSITNEQFIKYRNIIYKKVYKVNEISTKI